MQNFQRIHAIDEVDDHFSLVSIYNHCVERHGERKAKKLTKMMFGNYTNVDIVDTGVFDCYKKEYIEKIQRDADLINVPLSHVEGSNRVMEKLVIARGAAMFHCLRLNPFYAVCNKVYR